MTKKKTTKRAAVGAGEAADASPAASLPSTDTVIHAYKSATPARKAMMIAGGIAVVCTAPYWGPAVWRSKTARQVLTTGAGAAFSKLFT